MNPRTRFLMYLCGQLLIGCFLVAGVLWLSPYPKIQTTQRLIEQLYIERAAQRWPLAFILQHFAEAQLGTAPEFFEQSTMCERVTTLSPAERSVRFVNAEYVDLPCLAPLFFAIERAHAEQTSTDVHDETEYQRWKSLGHALADRELWSLAGKAYRHAYEQYPHAEMFAQAGVASLRSSAWTLHAREKLAAAEAGMRMLDKAVALAPEDMTIRCTRYRAFLAVPTYFQLAEVIAGDEKILVGRCP